jgi:ribose 5-phosphate isomerase B
MKVALASDHGAFGLKKEIKDYLTIKGYDVIDFGSHSDEIMDYPDTIKLAAKSVAKGESERGIVLCGSGIGASIVANKIKGIRAVLCMDEYSAEYSRRHNDANILALAGRRRTMVDAARYIDIWFSTPFEGERHQKRLDKIKAIENEERL